VRWFPLGSLRNLPAFPRKASPRLTIAEIAEAAFFTQGRIERHLASFACHSSRVRRFH
jgi:hypothetical protein